MPAAASTVNPQQTGRWPRRLGLSLMLLLVCAALAAVAYRYAEDAAIDRLRVSGAQRLDTYAAGLEHLLSKYDFLPGTFELNKDVIALQRRDMNIYLERVNRLAGSTSIYIVNLKGVTQAASNWRAPDSYVGDYIAFRPYIREALRGMPGGFYGVGTTRGEPGYYFARGIYHEGRMLGVATVKVNIESLEASWAEAGGKALLTDAHGVVFLSSVPEWKYRTLAPLTPAARQELEQSRQYFSHALTPLGLREVRALDARARIVTGPPPATGPMLSQSRGLVKRNWQMVYLSDLAPARASARAAALLTVLSEALAVMLVLYARQRHRLGRQRQRAREDLQRAYDQLEHLVADRTASLEQITRELRDENAVRRQAEEQLRKAQSELVQAGKMAVLGQLSAGITHELNQPLTALRTMADNARVLIERGRHADASANLTTISQLVERMGQLTGQLRQFARKSDTRPSAVPVADAVTAALFLVERRIAQERVGFRMATHPRDLYALCDSNRLQQVLVNLFSNALDAMEMAGSHPRQLVVEAGREGARVLISVTDSGPGIPEDVRAHLFEPFFTTKPQGKGLGLGLAISEQIVRESGGRLRAESPPEGGARFIIDLPRAE